MHFCCTLYYLWSCLTDAVRRHFLGSWLDDAVRRHFLWSCLTDAVRRRAASLARPIARFAASLAERARTDAVVLSHLVLQRHGLLSHCSCFFWLFIKLQEHFLQRCLFGLQAYDLVTAERLGKWIHIATYIEVAGTVIVILAYHAHARDTSKLFRRHGVAELYRHPLPCLLTQRFYLFNGHAFALTNDSHALAYLLHVAHDLRTH